MEPARCSCGCGTLWLVTKALQPCECGCVCCSESVASAEQELVELETLRRTIDARLRLVAADEAVAPRRRRNRIDVHHKLIGVGLLVVLFPFVLVAWVARTSHLASDRTGLRAPVFALPALRDGKPYGTAELRGRPAIVVFWTPGCASCADELRMLQQSWERHRHLGLAVLGVQVGFIGDPDATGVLDANGVTLPNVRDRSGVVAGAFGLMGVPEAHFVDPQWRVRAVDRGSEVGVDARQGLVLWDAIPPDILERRITELLRTPALVAS